MILRRREAAAVVSARGYERPRQDTDIEALKRRAANATARRRAAVSSLWDELRRFEGRDREVPRVLLVDDDTDYRDVLACAFRTAFACEVCEAGSADVGLGHAQAEAFDLVVTDLRLPGMSGTEMVEHLRKQSMRPLVPVLVLTNFPHEAERAFRMPGVTRLAEKAMGLTAIVALVRELLDTTAAIVQPR